MKALNIILLFLFIQFQTHTCTVSNINIQPTLAILNSTSTKKFICTKENDDYQGFEINLSPNISSEYIQISIIYLNNTSIEITMQSFEYIGAFYLICSSRGEQNSGSRSDIAIGKPPGLLMRAKRCVVYYDEYIDCTILAPIMVQAINNRLGYEFQFIERPLYSRPRAYGQNPKLVKIDSINKTLTFRWFPEYVGYFPSQLKMVVYGTIRYYGSTNHTMDMTPIFNISSNFTVQGKSPTDLQIEFNHGNFSSFSICHGNLTNDEKIPSSNRENIVTFGDFNETTRSVTGLRSNTWYRLCFHCRRDESFDTISDIVCHRYKTLKTTFWSAIITVISVVFCLLIILVAILLVRKRWDWMKDKLTRLRCCKKPPASGPECFPLQDLTGSIYLPIPVLNNFSEFDIPEIIPHEDPQGISDEI